MSKIFFVNFLFFVLSSHVQAQSGGATLFDETTHTIRINFSDSNYWSKLRTNKAADDANNTNTYIPAQVIVDNITLNSVGIQFKGNSSYYNYPSNKKPFTLSFDEYVSGQALDSLKSLNLNNLYQDPSFMREKLFLDFANQKGLYAPRANYAKLYINNQYWGLYLMCERIKKLFTNGRFGNSVGNLFKGDNGTTACANLKYHGALSVYYGCYELTNNATTNNWTDLVDLTNQIASAPDAQFNTQINTVLNAPSFIGAWAAYNLFCNFDSYPYRFTHNYYLYRNTRTNKFEWIIWDVSTAFGLDIPSTIASIENQSVLYLTPNVNDRPLAKRMLDNPAFKNTYLQTICAYANYDFLPTVLNPKIDKLYQRIKADVYSDSLKMYSNANFDNNINGNTTISGNQVIGLKSFIANRSQAVRNELTTLGYSNCPKIISSTSEFDNGQFVISPNPTHTHFELTSNINLSECELKIFDMQGRLCKTQVLNQTASNTIDISALNAGVYSVQITGNGRFFTQKLIKI